MGAPKKCAATISLAQLVSATKLPVNTTRNYVLNLLAH